MLGNAPCAASPSSRSARSAAGGGGGWNPSPPANDQVTRGNFAEFHTQPARAQRIASSPAQRGSADRQLRGRSTADTWCRSIGWNGSAREHMETDQRAGLPRRRAVRPVGLLEGETGMKATRLQLSLPRRPRSGRLRPVRRCPANTGHQPMNADRGTRLKVDYVGDGAIVRVNGGQTMVLKSTAGQQRPDLREQERRAAAPAGQWRDVEHRAALGARKLPRRLYAGSKGRGRAVTLRAVARASPFQPLEEARCADGLGGTRFRFDAIGRLVRPCESGL